LYGPASCGKTHLAGQWAQKSGAFWITGRDVDEDFLARLPHSPEKSFVVEDVHQVTQEADLFHLLNLLSQKNVFFLLTDASSPMQLPFALPDLTSRLRALPSVAMLEPDDDLLQKTLASHFSARGLHVGPEVLAYLHPRIHRSFQGLYDVVDRLDQASLSYQKEISIPFVRETLGF
jgi:chromosomal replication initiation ATPase DnaA